MEWPLHKMSVATFLKDRANKFEHLWFKCQKVTYFLPNSMKVEPEFLVVVIALPLLHWFHLFEQFDEECTLP